MRLLYDATCRSAFDLQEITLEDPVLDELPGMNAVYNQRYLHE